MKKTLAFILALLMVVSLLPAAAMAEEIEAVPEDIAPVVIPLDELGISEEDLEEEPAEEPAEEETEEEPAEKPAEEPVEEPAEESVEEPVLDGAPGQSSSRGSRYDHLDVKVPGSFGITVNGVPYSLSGTVSDVSVQIGSNTYNMGTGTRGEDSVYEYNISASISPNSIVWNSSNSSTTAYWQMSNVKVSFTIRLSSVPEALLPYAAAIGILRDSNGYYIKVENLQYTGYQQCTGGRGMRFDPSDGNADDIDNTGTPTGLDLYLEANILANVLTDGRLLIEKILVDESGNAVSDTETTFTFEVTDADGDPVYFTSEGVYTTSSANGTNRFTITGGQVFSISDLPEGTYTVSELQNAEDGYILAKIVVGDTTTLYDSESAVAEINSNQNVVLLDFYNEKMSTTGAAGFRKVSYDLSDSGMSFPNPTITIYALTGSEDDGYALGNVAYTGTARVNDSSVLESDTSNNGHVYTVPDLVPGAYFIAESNYTADGYTVEDSAVLVSTNVDETVTGTHVRVPLAATTIGGVKGYVFTVEAGKTTYVGLHNEYTLKTADLTVTKSVTGGVTLPEGFKLIVTDADGKTVAELTKANADEGTAYTWTVEALPLGDYTVTETGAGVDGYSHAVIIDGREEADGAATVTLGENGKAVTVENAYTKIVGDLTITKTFSCTVPEHDHSFEDGGAALQELWNYFAIDVLDGTGTPVKVLTLDDATGSSGAYTWIVEDLPLGRYTVRESGYDLDHHTVTATVSADGGTAVLGVGTDVTVDADGSSVSITNTYEESDRIILRVPVEKTVTRSGDVAPETTTFTFNVFVSEKEFGYEYSPLYTFDAEGNAVAVTPTDGADFAFTLTTGVGEVGGVLAISGTAHDLANISDIRIEEVTESAPSGWTMDETEWHVELTAEPVNEPTTAYISRIVRVTSDGQHAINTETYKYDNETLNDLSISFTNDYKENLAAVEIPVTKVINNIGNQTTPSETFTFTLSGYEGASEYFSIMVGDEDITESGVFTITGGGTVTLVIEGTAADLEDLHGELTLTEEDGNKAYWNYDSNTWTYSAYSTAPPQAEFTNTYDKTELRIPVSKTIAVEAGSGTIPEAGSYTFDFTLYDLSADKLSGSDIQVVWQPAGGNAAVLTPDASGNYTFQATVTTDGNEATQEYANGNIILTGSAAEFEELTWLAIDETGAAGENWKNDDTVYYIQIDQTDWSVDLYYYDANGEAQTADTAAYVNGYLDQVYAVRFDLYKRTLSDTALGKTDFHFAMDVAAEEGYTLTPAFGYTVAGTSPNNEDDHLILTVDVTDGAAEKTAAITVTGTKDDLENITFTFTEEVGTPVSGWRYDSRTYTVNFEEEDGAFEPVISFGSTWTLSAVFFLNEYELPTGSLAVSKEFVIKDKNGEVLTDDQAEALVEKYLAESYTIRILAESDGAWTTVRTLTMADAIHTDGTNVWSWTVEDLPYAHYAVSETGIMIDHYEIVDSDPAPVDGVDYADGIVFSYNDDFLNYGSRYGSTDTFGSEFTLAEADTADGTVPSLDIVNNYKENPELRTADLKLSKTVEIAGDVVPDEDLYFYFDLTAYYTADGQLKSAGDITKLENITLAYTGAVNNTGDGIYLWVPAETIAAAVAEGKTSVTVSGTVEISATGINFDHIEYITIDEIDGGADYWTYDDTVYTARGDANKDPFIYDLYKNETTVGEKDPNTLVARPADGRNPTASFTNTYDQDLHSVRFVVQKDMKGDPTTQDKQFQFRLEASEDLSALSDYFKMEYEATGQSLSEVHGDGSFFICVPAGDTTASATITITGTAEDLEAAGYFTVTEVEGGDETIVYDSASWRVRIREISGGEGYEAVVRKLGVLDWTFDDEPAVFENTYNEPVYELIIPIQKIVDADVSMMDQTFTVQVLDQWTDSMAGTVIEPSKYFALNAYTSLADAEAKENGTDITDSGEFTITAEVSETEDTMTYAWVGISFTAADQANLEVIRVNESLADVPAGWVYDDNYYLVSIDEENAGNYQTKTWKYGTVEPEEYTLSALAFTNTYKLHTVKIPVVKTIAGDKTTKDMTFTYDLALYDIDMNPVSAGDTVDGMGDGRYQINFSDHFTVAFTGAAKGEQDGDTFTITVPAGTTSPVTGAIEFTGTNADFDLIYDALWIGVTEDTTDVPENWEYDDTAWYFYFYNGSEAGEWISDIRYVDPDAEDEEDALVEAEQIKFINTYNAPGVTPPPADNVPDTGDNTPIALLSMMFACCGAALTFLFSRKRKEN